MNQRNLFFIPIILISEFLLFNCKDSSRDNFHESQDSSVKVIRPKFHTSQNEGIWKGKGKTHMPNVEFSESGDNKIKVNIPLKPSVNPRHYIEVIVLMQGARNQIAIKRFKPNEKNIIAEFKLPDPKRDDYYIIAKCNLHDMWRTKVVLKQKE